MSAAPILETCGLTCRFGGVTAVDNVDLTIAEGELGCLIGPNGAGKSTLFKCMTRQLRATSGDILLRGRSVVSSHPHQIARMGVAIKNQIASVYSGLSVRENIWVAGRRLHRGDELERSVTAILNEIGFDEPSRFNLKVDALSHAHRQWVELGMLLATNPILALLDEPAAGMTRDEMLKTIKLIRRLNEFATIIVVEHDLEFISLLAKRVTVLHRGAILLEDSMENVARSPLVREIYVCAGYGTAPVLRNISFTQLHGEVLGVVGHNGMGKTTLLRTIVGLLQTASGAIEFDGEPIEHMPAYRRSSAGIGYVPQGNLGFPDLSVAENLELARAMKGRCSHLTIEAVAALASRVLVMQKGQIAQELASDKLSESEILGAFGVA